LTFFFSCFVSFTLAAAAFFSTSFFDLFFDSSRLAFLDGGSEELALFG